MSTGDPRRSGPQKSTNPAAAGDTDAETTDGPVGGVLPVKKAVRSAGKAGTGSAARRTGANGGGRTGSAGNGTTRAGDSTPDDGGDAPGTGPAKTKPARTAPGKAKAAPAKAAGAKGTGGATRSGGRSTVTETIESTSVLGRKSATTAPTRQRLSARPGKGGRPPAAPVRVAERRNWGSILLYAATGLLALAIIGYAVTPIVRSSLEGPWQEQAASIPGIANYIDPSSPNYSQASTLRNHEQGDLGYEVTPPVGGNHNNYWQRCMGDVYTSQIADEHAVHSLEHGAVWITYNPNLGQDQVDKLASRVRDVEYMMMSPYPDLDPPISLQAWGYQLKVDNADDGRIDDFIKALRRNATQEPDAGCSGGITDATATPLDLQGGM